MDLAQIPQRIKQWVSSLTNMVMLVGLGGVVLTSLAFTVGGSTLFRRSLEDIGVSDYRTVGGYLGQNLLFPLSAQDRAIVDELLKGFLKNDERVVAVGVFSSKTELFTAHITPQSPITLGTLVEFFSALAGEEISYKLTKYRGKSLLLYHFPLHITETGVSMAFLGRNPSQDHYLLMVVDLEGWIKKPYRAYLFRSLLTALFIALLLGGGGFLLTYPRVRDLRQITAMAHTVAEEGGLEQKVPETLVVQPGEIGQLSRAFDLALKAYRELFSELKGLSETVAARADEIHIVAREVLKGSQVQSQSADETSASMEEMAALVASVAENAQKLATRADDVAAQIEEMSSSIEEISRITEQEAVQVEETSTTIEEMVANIRVLTGRMNELVSKRAEVERSFDSAQEAVGESLKVLGDLSRNAEETSHAIRSLLEKSENIGRISEVLQDIADLTNILALNAAIEAARAGEAGRGFAVVADEVRRLAERSLTSAREISGVVREVQKEMDRLNQLAQAGAAASRTGITASDNVSRNLIPLGEHVLATTAFLKDIDLSMQSQVQASTGVLEAVSRLLTMTEQVKNATNEQAQVSQAIVKAMEEMKLHAHQVAQATQEQKRGGELVVLAVENITQIASQNLKAMEKLTSISEDLFHHSENLFNMIAKYSRRERAA